MQRLILALAMVVILAIPAHADFGVGGWNLESGDSDVNYLAIEISQWSKIGIWGFSEVQNKKVLQAMCGGLNTTNPEASFIGIIGTTGGADKLAVAFDQNSFDAVQYMEIGETNIGGRQRATLAVQFHEKATGKDFIFLVNHLARGDKQKREQQSHILRQWAAAQDLPVIMTGDFNYDCELPELTKCNSGFDALMSDSTFEWVKPVNPIRTQCNRKYNSILDFVFVSGHAKKWVTASKILNEKYEACNDNAQKADHRPVVAGFKTITQ